jgi:integrase
VLRKGGKVVTIPLAPRTARALDLAIGERVERPIFLARDGERLHRHTAWRIVRRLARKAGINKPVGPHTFRRAFITAALDAGSRSETSKRQPATPIPERRCTTTERGSLWIGMPPTSSRPSSPAPPAEKMRRVALS